MMPGQGLRQAKNRFRFWALKAKHCLKCVKKQSASKDDCLAPAAARLMKGGDLGNCKIMFVCRTDEQRRHQVNTPMVETPCSEVRTQALISSDCRAN